MKKHSVRHLTIAALLIGMGIVIPMVMPKIVIGPASFTLASHVPLFVAMFFSPGMAIAVALGTTFGFFITLPPIIAARCFCRDRGILFTKKSKYFIKERQANIIQCSFSSL